MRLLGMVGSPAPGGRTRAAVAGILAGAEGADTDVVELSTSTPAELAPRIEAADGIVLGSPVFRASYSALVKSVLEATERGRWGETTAPLQGKVAAIVLTGASPAHFLAANDLRNVLCGFFAVQVLAPALYFDHGAYLDRETLNPEAAQLAGRHGRALVDLAAAVRGSEALAALTPQV